jgi:hypothetical protein
LRATHCGNAACTADNVSTTIDDPNDSVGELSMRTEIRKAIQLDGRLFSGADLMLSSFAACFRSLE